MTGLGGEVSPKKALRSLRLVIRTSGTNACLLWCVLALVPFLTYVQGPPIFTDTPIMLGLDGGGVRTFGKYVSRENATAFMHPAAFPYNISDNLQAGGILPFVYMNPESERLDSKSGLGDASAFFKFGILQKDWKAKTLRSLIKIQETFPTGDRESMPPLGTGEYQTLISLVSGFVTTGYGIYTEWGYNISSRTGTETFLYNTAFGLPLLPQKWPPRQFNLYLELNGSYLLDSEQNATFLSPGVQWIAGKRVLLEAGFQYPLAEDVPDNMETHFTVLLGTRMLIF